jgi:hypothetical protein
MRKGLLLLFIISASAFAVNAQTITRIKSWGYLDSPPVPKKTFVTNSGVLQILEKYPVSELVKVSTDGTFTRLTALRTSFHYEEAISVTSGDWTMISYSKADSVFFYLTDGTAAKTKLVYTYKGRESTRYNNFTLHKGKAYIVYDIGYGFFQGMVEINPDDFTSKVIFNKAAENLGLYADFKMYSVISNNESLLVNYLTGGVNYVFEVNTADGSLTQVSDKLNYWTPQNPFVLLGKTLAAFTLEDVRVSMNGSNFQTKRMLLSKYNATAKTFEPLWYVGYFQAEQPSYLGEINGKHYFFSNGDYNVTNCNTTNCSGYFGAHLWEVTETGARLVKSVAEAGEKSYTYAGIKQVASDKIYLEITTKAAGKELWVATPTDLYMVKDHIGTPSVLKDYGLKLNEAAVCGGNIAIPGVGAMAQTGNDNELYFSDGTVGKLDKIDVMPKAGVQSLPKGLFFYQDKIYFTAADTLKDNLGIAKTSMFTIDLCNAVTAVKPEMSTSKSELKVYPNPVKGFLNLQTEETIETIEIYSVTGTLLIQMVYPEKQIDVSHLKNGLYLIKAQTGEKRLTSKFYLVQ